MTTRTAASAGSRPRRWRTIAGVLLAASLIVNERPAVTYSVLAHESAVDALWDPEIARLLRERFPRATPDEIATARAYAYGGSLIQDLGYYPFGSHLFTNLTHYVGSGEFVQSLLRNATNVNELAFAVGALAHYASDNLGHPLAVNPSVPLMYPKVRAKVGDRALYVDSPARHLMVEFAFDVLQVARGAYVGQAYRDRIGFGVSKELLDRATHETYGVHLSDLMMNVDLAIGTYRRAVATTIPKLTRMAWRDKRDEIEKATPGVTEQSFVYELTQPDYEREFGDKYQKPGFLSRVLAVILKTLPKVGPLKPLAFEPLSEEADRLFAESIKASHARYRTALQAVRAGRLNLPDTDFDTGRAPSLGVNRLADETHADLLHKLARQKFAGVSLQLRQHLKDFFANAPARHTHFTRREESRIRGELAQLGAP